MVFRSRLVCRFRGNKKHSFMLIYVSQSLRTTLCSFGLLRKINRAYVDKILQCPKLVWALSTMQGTNEHTCILFHFISLVFRF